MKRRDLIKTGLLGLSAGAVTLSGCNKEDVAAGSELKIIPKQTGIYEFSCPLPFNNKTIDDIVELNSTLKKSKITTLYNSIPLPIGEKFNRWIHIERGVNHSIKTYDDFFRYVDYAHDKGFKVTYLMNSPKPFSEKDFNTFKNEFEHLVDLLVEHNIKDIKVGNVQVIEIINNYKPGVFNFSASCAFEYHNIGQYSYLFNNYSDFSLIDVTYDENQNFRLLKSLRESFPKIKLELMVNEMCIKNCPARISHISESKFSRYDCQKLTGTLGDFQYFTKSSYIYPWDIEYYSALGINNFKFAASAYKQKREDFRDISQIKMYLNIIEKGLDGFNIFDFMLAALPTLHSQKKVDLSIIKPLFPDIRYFIAHGHECSYRCETDCNYCNECAKALENVLMYS